VRDRAERFGSEIRARGRGQLRGFLCRRREGGDVAVQSPHRALRPGQLHEPRPRPQAQAVDACEGDQAHYGGPDPQERHGCPHQDISQRARPGEGRDRPGHGQKTLRQARHDQAPRVGPPARPGCPPLAIA